MLGRAGIVSAPGAKSEIVSSASILPWPRQSAKETGGKVPQIQSIGDRAGIVLGARKPVR